MATTKTMSLGDSNTTIDLQVNGSPVITAADVVSTYSATGTNPVDGKAVAEAIATVSSSGNNYWDKTEEYDGDVLWYSPHNGGGDYGVYPAGILFNSTNELDGVYWKTSSNGTYDTENCLNYSMMEGLVNHMSGGTTSGHHTISLARSLTSGTKVGTITLDGTAYALYAPAKTTVSSTYSATSTNAMNGVAVASAISSALSNVFSTDVSTTITDAGEAPLGMYTVNPSTCEDLPSGISGDHWILTFRNTNGRGVQLLFKASLTSSIFYFRQVLANAGAWRKVTGTAVS